MLLRMIKSTEAEQIYFGISTPFSSLSLFTPSITAGLGFKDLQAQLMTVPPYAVACMYFTKPPMYSTTNLSTDVVTLLVSYSADYFNSYVIGFVVRLSQCL
jgi:hypothetical protein